MCIAGCLTIPSLYSLDSNFHSLLKAAAKKSEDIAIGRLQTKLPLAETTALTQDGNLNVFSWAARFCYKQRPLLRAGVPQGLYAFCGSW